MFRASPFRRKPGKGTTRRLVGQFLGFYSQCTLEDLETMPTERFWYLFGAMLDVTNPDLTDPVEEVATRRMREKVIAEQRRR